LTKQIPGSSNINGKSGTNHHFSFMTLYVTNNGKRVTLAVVPLYKGLKIPPPAEGAAVSSS